MNQLGVRKNALFVDIKIDLPLFLIDHLKYVAKKKGITSQSLMKVFLAEKAREEFRGN